MLLLTSGCACACRTNTFRVLMALLLDPPPELDCMDEEIQRKRFPDLVVKCLIRATKKLSGLGPLRVHGRHPISPKRVLLCVLVTLMSL